MPKKRWLLQLRVVVQEQIRAKTKAVRDETRAVRAAYRAGSAALQAELRSTFAQRKRLNIGELHTAGNVVASRKLALWHDLIEVLERNVEGTLLTGALGIRRVLKACGIPLDWEAAVQAALRQRAAMAALRRRFVASSGADSVTVLRQRWTQFAKEDMSLKHVVRHAVEEYGADNWRATRVIVTETSRTFNAAQAAILRDAGLLMRWTELVSDAGRPLDKRVGVDSIVLHGQVAEPGGLFTMPPDPRVGHMAGATWPHPPNRPNDRAILLPLDPTVSDIPPCYKVVGGARVPLVWDVAAARWV